MDLSSPKGGHWSDVSPAFAPFVIADPPYIPGSSEAPRLLRAEGPWPRTDRRGTVEVRERSDR